MTIGIGDIVYNRRRELGMTQRELAEKAGIDSVTVSTLECGKFAPRYDTLMLVLGALGLKMEIVEEEKNE